MPTTVSQRSFGSKLLIQIRSPIGSRSGQRSTAHKRNAERLHHPGGGDEVARFHRLIARPALDEKVSAALNRAERHVLDETGVGDARQRADAVDQVAIAPRQPRDLTAADRERQAGGEDAGRREAGIDRAQAREALKQQPGGGQQHQRQGNLGNDEQRLHPPRPPRRGLAARARLEHLVDVGPRGAPRRQGAEEHARRQRQANAEGHHPRIDAHLAAARQRRRQQHADQIHRPERQQQADGAAGGGQQQALREQMAEEVRALCAQGSPHRQLALSRCGADEQQIGDVHAHDQQQQADGAEQDQQRRPYASHQMARQWNHGGVLALVRPRILLLQAARRGADLRLGRLGRHVLAQPADHPVVVRRPHVAIGQRASRHP
jgi:hypothetical protein